MTSTMTTGNSTIDLGATGGWRSIKSRLMIGLLGTAFVIVMIPLVLVLATVIMRGGKVMSWSCLTSDIAASERRTSGGIGPAIVGTLLTTGIATAIAAPLGVLGAIYLAEYAGTSLLGRVVRFMSSVMTGVPSIVMGLFVYLLFTLRFKQNAFGGALALACLMLPIIIRSTEEMLRLVPTTLREASYGLGTSKARTIISIVLPAALPGVVSGVLLAVARAAGETAPLLFTIGAAKGLNLQPFSGANTALSAQIFGNASSPVEAAQARGWGAALTLVALAFSFTIFARLVSARFSSQR